MKYCDNLLKYDSRSIVPKFKPSSAHDEFNVSSGGCAYFQILNSRKLNIGLKTLRLRRLGLKFNVGMRYLGGSCQKAVKKSVFIKSYGKMK